MSKPKHKELIPHASADSQCPCFGCSGAREARGGKSTKLWFERPYGKATTFKFKQED